MDIQEIKSIEQCEQFCEGVLNDFETGIITKDEALIEFFKYTEHLHDFFSKQVNKINKKYESNR